MRVQCISIVCVSACGLMVCTSTTSGCITVHSYANGSVVASLTHPKRLTITGLVWHPTDSQQMAFVDKHGQLGAIISISLKVSFNSRDSIAAIML